MEIYLVDDAGYLSDHFPAQPNIKRPGEYLLPPDAILTAPEQKEGFWPKYDRVQNLWTYEKIPTCAEDFLSMKPISHQSQSPRDVFYRQLIDQLKDENPNIELKRGEEDLSWYMAVKPEKTLEEVRSEKLSSLNSAHQQAEDSAYVRSSLGFVIDADERANRDIDGLIKTMPEPGTTYFCDYNNDMHAVTKSDCETMQKEVIANAQSLYTQKWNYRVQIEEAKTKEELEAINIKFKYMEF